MELLAKLVSEDEEYLAMSDDDKADAMKNILKMLEGEVQLRSKRELIEKFINEQMPNISASNEVKDSFDTFWREEQIAALDELCEDEGLFEHQVQKIISDLNFTGQTPRREAVVSSMQQKPKILERKTVIERVTDKIMKLVRTFEDDIGRG